MMNARYIARSASDRTDDWPFWFVADRQRGDVNVTGELADILGIARGPGQTLTDRGSAAWLAAAANENAAGVPAQA